MMATPIVVPRVPVAVPGRDTMSSGKGGGADIGFILTLMALVAVALIIRFVAIISERQ